MYPEPRSLPPTLLTLYIQMPTNIFTVHNSIICWPVTAASTLVYLSDCCYSVLRLAPSTSTSTSTCIIPIHQTNMNVLNDLRNATSTAQAQSILLDFKSATITVIGFICNAFWAIIAMLPLLNIILANLLMIAVEILRQIARLESFYCPTLLAFLAGCYYFFPGIKDRFWEPRF